MTTTAATRVQFASDPADPRHGTVNGYAHLRCRCQRCRAAWAAHCQQQRDARSQREAPVHGRQSTYTNWKCRCAACREAGRRQHAERRAAPA